MCRILLPIASILFFACEAKQPPAITNIASTEIDTLPVTQISKVGDIPLPQGFILLASEENSFARYLEAIPIKDNSTVYLYNGDAKANQNAQYAVLDISVGEKDLQQCADAVMRLRAEYLFAQQKFSEIVFMDNAGKKYLFTAPFTRNHFDEYLQQVFGMCGSASLEKQLIPKTDFAAIEAGDVIIKGGFPGHAVIVLAAAQNAMGEKAYLLAQSYMPAQNIHVLRNPMLTQNSPWYFVNDNNAVETPEYYFEKKHLRTWP
jgi:hypothetical protein